MMPDYLLGRALDKPFSSAYSIAGRPRYKLSSFQKSLKKRLFLLTSLEKNAARHYIVFIGNVWILLLWIPTTLLK